MNRRNTFFDNQGNLLDTVYIDVDWRTFRKYRNKEVADKYLKRILRLIKDPEVNLISKRHGISRKLEKREKVFMLREKIKDLPEQSQKILLLYHHVQI